MEDIFKKEYAENEKDFCFETTSIIKILILSLLSDGVYLVILSFAYWKRLRDNFGHKLSPFWRAIFIGFTNFPLFTILEKYLKHFNYNSFNGVALAITFFFLNSTLNKMQFKALKYDEINWTFEAISIVIMLITTGIFMFIQSKINNLNEERFPDAPKNVWKISNTIWAIVLVLFNIFYYLP